MEIQICLLNKVDSHCTFNMSLSLYHSALLMLYFTPRQNRLSSVESIVEYKIDTILKTSSITEINRTKR